MRRFGRGGSLLLAVLLGLVSVPLVAASFANLAPHDVERLGVTRLPWSDALPLALASALSASLVGGLAGGTVIRTRYIAGALVAIATAWPVGIAVLPLAANLLQVNLRMAGVCIDACTTYLNSQDPLSGIIAYAISLGVGAAVVVPIGIALVAAALAVAVRDRRSAPLGVVFVIVGYGALHVWSIASGGAAPFACLAVGTFCWAFLVRPPHVVKVPKPVPVVRWGGPPAT